MIVVGYFFFHEIQRTIAQIIFQLLFNRMVQKTSDSVFIHCNMHSITGRWTHFIISKCTIVTTKANDALSYRSSNAQMLKCLNAKIDKQTIKKMTLPKKNKNHLKMRGSYFRILVSVSASIQSYNYQSFRAFCVVVANAAKNDYTQNGKNIIIRGINMEPNVY